MQDHRDEIYSKRLRAGKTRTYFFDVRETRNSQYYITITESKKKQNENYYVKHKIFVYQEDFSKFIDAFTNTVNHVKKDLMPEYQFEEYFDYEEVEEEAEATED